MACIVCCCMSRVVGRWSVLVCVIRCVLLWFDVCNVMLAVCCCMLRVVRRSLFVVCSVLFVDEAGHCVFALIV